MQILEGGGGEGNLVCQNRQRSSEKMSSNELRNRVAVQNADFHRPSNAFRLQIADCRLLAATLNPSNWLQIADCRMRNVGKGLGKLHSEKLDRKWRFQIS